MASIIIRNLEDDVKARLKLRAAARGRSMEEEARDTLRQAVGATDPRANIGLIIAERFAALNVTLPLMDRRA